MSVSEKLSHSETLQNKWADDKVLGINLDPNPQLIPEKYYKGTPRETASLADQARAMEELLVELTPLVKEHCLMAKVNLAFFEGHPYFARLLRDLISALRLNDATLPIIGDSKRTDVDESGKRYAQNLFETLGFDAITTPQGMGLGGLDPFLKHHGKGIYLLNQTSNRDPWGIQEMPIDLEIYQRMLTHSNQQPLSEKEYELAADLSELWSEKYAIEKESDEIERYTSRESGLYQISTDYAGKLPLSILIALRIQTLAYASQNPNIGLVNGANRTENLPLLRMAAPDLPILVPAIGTQSKPEDLERVIRFGQARTNFGLVPGVGRSVIFADDPKQAFLDIESQIKSYINKE